MGLRAQESASQKDLKVVEVGNTCMEKDWTGDIFGDHIKKLTEISSLPNYSKLVILELQDANSCDP